jgi:hypothetical protein
LNSKKYKHDKIWEEFWQPAPVLDHPDHPHRRHPPLPRVQANAEEKLNVKKEKLKEDTDVERGVKGHGIVLRKRKEIHIPP